MDLQALLAPLAIVFGGVAIAWQVRRHVAFSLVALQLFLLGVGAWGAYRIETRQNEQQETQERIEKTQRGLEVERRVRSQVQGEINRYVCSENNNQDQVLAGLIEVSLGGQSSFGDGIDRSRLSPFDLAVVSSINKVQKLSEGKSNQLTAAFEKALEELREKTPCAEIVRAFLVASTTDDLKAIRRILREAADDRLASPKKHGSGK